MKKLLTLALVLAMCLCGCGSGGGDKTADTSDTEGTVVITDCETPDEPAPKGAKPDSAAVYDSHGNIHYRMDYEYDAEGRAVKITNTDAGGKEMSRTLREYNADGNEAKVLLYSNDELVSREETKYDGDKKIEKIKYDAAGNVSYSVKYEYDSRGNVVREARYTDKGEVDSVFEISCDEDGKETERTQLSADGSTVMRTVYEYTDGGELLRSTQYYGDGSLYGCYESEYDANGNISKLTEYKSDGKLRNVTVYEYGKQK